MQPKTYEPLYPRTARLIARIVDRRYYWRRRSKDDAAFTFYVWDRYGMAPTTIAFHAATRLDDLIAHQHAEYAGKPRAPYGHPRR